MPLTAQGAGAGANPLAPTRWVSHLVRHLGIAAEGKDPEGVHQVRVAGRRLRVWLSLGARRALEDDLRWLVQVLGRVRDLDVLCAMPIAEAGDFAQWLRTQRSAARVEAEDVLASFRVEGLCRALEVAPPLDGHGARKVLRDLEADVGKRSRRWLEVRRGPHPPPAGLDELHRLRRALRKLRYAKEWLGERDERLGVLQDVFGAVCDVAAMLRLLDAFCAQTQATAPASREALVRALAAMMERAWGEWAALKVPPPRAKAATRARRG